MAASKKYRVSAVGCVYNVDREVVDDRGETITIRVAQQAHRGEELPGDVSAGEIDRLLELDAIKAASEFPDAPPAPPEPKADPKSK